MSSTFQANLMSHTPYMSSMYLFVKIICCGMSSEIFTHTYIIIYLYKIKVFKKDTGVLNIGPRWIPFLTKVEQFSALKLFGYQSTCACGVSMIKFEFKYLFPSYFNVKLKKCIHFPNCIWNARQGDLEMKRWCWCYIHKWKMETLMSSSWIMNMIMLRS